MRTYVDTHSHTRQRLRVWRAPRHGMRACPEMGSTPDPPSPCASRPDTTARIHNSTRTHSHTPFQTQTRGTRRYKRACTHARAHTHTYTCTHSFIHLHTHRGCACGGPRRLGMRACTEMGSTPDPPSPCASRPETHTVTRGTRQMQTNAHTHTHTHAHTHTHTHAHDRGCACGGPRVLECALVQWGVPRTHPALQGR